MPSLQPLPTGRISGAPVERLYVHFPFCHRICPYCAFHKHTFAGFSVPAFLSALLAELKFFRQLVGLLPKSVYFGGGTPGALSPSLLEKFLEAFCRQVDLSTLEEWTVEMNPAVSMERKIRVLKNSPVNRISLGVQSWDPEVLKTLGRDHSPEIALEACEQLRAYGFERVALDHIFGVPGQSLESWTETWETSVRLPVASHLSAYALAFEPGTEFRRRLERGELKARTPDQEAEFLEAARRVAERRGFRRYEVSNYAAPGHESDHNLACWLGEDYLGLGPGAASAIRGIRWRNPPDTAAFISRRTPEDFGEVAGLEFPEAESLRLERVACLLRVRRGVPLDLLGDASRKLAQLEEAGLGAVDAGRGRFIPSDRGMLLADEIALELA